MHSNHKASVAGFTRTELMIVIGVIVLLLLLFLPALKEPEVRTSHLNCVNNLKQVGLSFRLWSGDNNDKYPMQVSTNEGGTMELVSAGVVFPHYTVMSNELSTPKILCCPNESQRAPVAYFTNLTDTNISYFVVPEADETLPEMWLCGDRNLATNSVALKPGLFTLTPNRAVRWTTEMHNNRGNLCFADGSVMQSTSGKLQASAADALRAYHKATTNTTFRLAIP